MAKVKYMTSANGISRGQKFLLVMYGHEYVQTGYDFGLINTVTAPTVKNRE